MMNMKRYIERLIPAIPVATVLGAMLFSHSCANTTTPPSGGDKDTIPPVITNIYPLPGTVNVPVHNTQIAITFNEYVTVKDPKGIFLSPPLEKSPKYKIRGKSIIVYFESDLEPNTTYTLDLTNAIADNNEGNMYPGYTLMFSTGPQIDSMAITGVVRDCNTLQPMKGVTVMLYKDLADSAIFKHRPDAAVKTDDWGFFALRNIADTTYRLYAVKDESSNNIYDPDNDLIAFCDSIIRPTIVASDDLPELKKYDMKDTLHCMDRKAEYEMVMFREKPSKQMIVNRERTQLRSAYVTFMAPGALIDSMWVRGIPADRLITQFNIQHDSLEFWINDRKRMPDTLNVFIDYMKTDTLGKLAPFTEHLKLTMEKTGGKSKSSRRDIKHEDTTCVMTVTAEPENIEQSGFGIEFKYPIINENFDSLTLTSVNPRQQESKMKFSIERDTLNLRKYVLRPEGKLMTGYEYKLKIPARRFRDINGFYNDSSDVKVSLPKDDKLSSLTLDLTGVHNKYIVELLNEKRDKVLRTYIIENDSALLFPYLKAGKYSIRITEDVNKNGIVDTGSLLEHRQPEKVMFYKLRDGSYVLTVKESTEMEQKIDISKMFAK
mgnify:CR=1 FL=1